MNKNTKAGTGAHVKGRPRHRLKRRAAATHLGRRLQRAGFLFQNVADVAGVTVRMVQYHLTGRSESPRVAAAIVKLLGTNGAAA
jgi:hypothetical protein